MIVFIDGELKGKVVFNGPPKWEYIHNGEEESTYYICFLCQPLGGFAKFYTLCDNPSPEYILDKIKEIQDELNSVGG